MTTAEVVALILRFAGGLALGAAFFGGLAWTVRRVPTSGNPALLVLGSFFLRMVGAAIGFIWLGGRQWQFFLAAVGGFLAAKLGAMVLLTENKTDKECHIESDT